jgi:hypothetical protein
MTARAETLDTSGSRLAVSPHLALGVAAGGVLVCEWLRGSATLDT